MPSSSGLKMERVYSQIYGMIVRGELGQGARLVERDLAEKFAVSRTVIREVIHKMARDGLVEWNRKDKNARPVVAPLYEREMEELNEIVAALEALAIRRIAAGPEKRRLAIAKELRELNQKLALLCKKEPLDIDALIEADNNFHAAYSYRGVGPRVAALRRAIKPQAERYIRAYMPAFITHTPAALKEHEEIIRALEKGDPEKADRAVHKNWRNASKRLLGVMARWNNGDDSHSGTA